MNKLILSLLLCLASSSAVALDFSKIKEKLRPHITSLLGEKTTNKILGEEMVEKNPTISLPKIPKIVLDAKNESFYDKEKNLLSTQGEKYRKLSNEEKKAFRISFLRQLYQETRNSKPKEAELIKSLNVLEQGGNREGVYRSVTLDQTYSALEGYDDPSSGALVNFIQYFTPKYLNKSFQKESLESLNLFALKRLLTEKCLELVDALAIKPDDVYRWYAVYSAEIAKNYPGLWTSKTRGNMSDEFHYRWSKSVPFQHIKSEIIIKTHRLMNHLQKQN